MWDFPLFPDSASTVAPEVDAIYIILSVVYGLIALVIAIFLVRFAMKYHRSKDADRRPLAHETWKYELLLIGAPLLAGIAIFAWAADTYFVMQRAPRDTLDIYVVGKQWMWHLQHPGGQREINTLHVPTDQPVRLVMTSQDVIHSFFVPAFRVKQDVLPGRTTTLWFEATKPGRYHLFCAEYCGTNHARMIGEVIVMHPRDYQNWLSAGASDALGAAALGGTPAGPAPMAQAGHNLFMQLGCNACHVPNDAQRGPTLEGLFNRPVALRQNQTVIADEQYIRESILQPNARIVAGYPEPSLMPSFAGRLTDAQLNELIEYIKSLSPNGAATTNEGDQGP